MRLTRKETLYIVWAWALAGSLSAQEEISTELVQVGELPEPLLLGEYPPALIGDYLIEIGNLSEASEFYASSVSPNRRRKAWEHAEAQIGYIANGGSFPRDVIPASQVKPNPKLKKIDVRIDRIFAQDYPGPERGMQKILFTFEAMNKVNSGEETVAFSQTYDIYEGQSAGITGYPVFNSLNVSDRGAQFELTTTYVGSAADQAKLAFLDSSAVKSGMSLLTTAQPALEPLVSLGANLSKMFLSPSNKQIWKLRMGLDYDDGAALGVRLNAGTYIAVQAPEDLFKWRDWNIDATSRIINKTDGSFIPFNYIVFRVEAR